MLIFSEKLNTYVKKGILPKILLDPTNTKLKVALKEKFLS